MNKKADNKTDKLLDFENFQFPCTFSITEFAYLLIETLFDVDSLFLTDLSEFSDFEFIYDIPGHEFKKYLDIPIEDRRKFYPEHENCTSDRLEILELRYPPISKEKWAKIKYQMRLKHHKMIETEFDISMDDYPKDEKLLVWKVAKFVQYKIQMKELSKYCC